MDELARIMIILLEISAPPTVFRAAFAELDRSNVKLTFVGPDVLCLTQLSITAVGIRDSPHSVKDFLRNSFLSIKDIFSFALDNVYVHTFSIQCLTLFINYYVLYNLLLIN